MSYRPGISWSVAAMIGREPCEPHIFCDECGLKQSAYTRAGGPAAWLLNRKAPKGWRMARTEDDRRMDWCPRCWPKFWPKALAKVEGKKP